MAAYAAESTGGLASVGCGSSFAERFSEHVVAKVRRNVCVCSENLHHSETLCMAFSGEVDRHIPFFIFLYFLFSFFSCVCVFAYVKAPETALYFPDFLSEAEADLLWRQVRALYNYCTSSVLKKEIK